MFIESIIFFLSGLFFLNIFFKSIDSKKLIQYEEKILEKWLKNIHSIKCQKKSCKFDIFYEGKIFNIFFHSLIFTPSNTVSKDKIILVHGANSGPTFWLDIVPYLIQNGYEVHCISIPGFGQSTISSLSEFEQIDVSNQINIINESIVKYIVINSIERPIIVGYSFSGVIVSRLVSSYPNVCKKFIIINSIGLFPGIADDGHYWTLLFYFGMPNSVIRLFDFLLKPLIYLLEHVKIMNEPSLLWFVYQIFCYENIGHKILSKCIQRKGSKYSWEQTIFCDIFFSQTPPCKFIWGSDDSIIPIEHAKFYEKLMKTKSKNIELLIPIENAWHIPIYKDKGRPLANSILQAIDESVDLPKFNIFKLGMIKHLFKDSYYGYSSDDNFINRELLFLKIYEILCETN